MQKKAYVWFCLCWLSLFCCALYGRSATNNFAELPLSHKDSMQLMLRAAFDTHTTTWGDTSIQPLRLLGERGMTDPYLEQNNSGIVNKAEADLKAAAMALVAAIPATIAANFKVYDYTAYSLIGRMENPEFWNEWAFGAMDSIIRTQYNVQYYLLIAKEINPADGKVKFRVKLSLPTVAGSGNRPSGDRSSPDQYPATLVWKWQETFKKVMEDYLFKDPGEGHYEAHELQGLITLTKMIKEGEGIKGTAWYRPDGYPINKPSGHHVDAIIGGPNSFPDVYKNGFVYGWVFLDKDLEGKTTFEATYKAVIKSNKFYGYYLNGVMDETDIIKDRYNDGGNTNKNEKILVSAVDYITEKCGGVEWRSTDFKQINTDYPPYPTDLKNTINDNSNLPQGYGYLSESATRTQIFNVCSTGKADTYERYFLFKLHKDNNTPETRNAITDFCLEIAERDDFFKSDALSFKGKYIYYRHSESNVNILNVHGNEERIGGFLPYLKFIEEVFLSENPNSWKAEDFKNAKKLVTQIVANIYIGIESGTHGYQQITIAPANQKTSFLFLVAERMSNLNRIKAITRFGTANNPGLLRSVFKPLILHTHEQSILNLITLIDDDKLFWAQFLRGSIDKKDLLVVANFLTSQKIRLIAEKKITNINPCIQVPFDISNFLAGCSNINYDNQKNHYSIKFNAAFFISTEHIIKYLPFTGGWQQGKEECLSDGLLSNNNQKLRPLDLILVKASADGFQASEPIDKKHEHLNVGDDYYLISPFILDIEHRMNREERNAAYIETGAILASVAFVGVEVLAARAAFIEGKIIQATVSSAWATLDAGVLIVNVIPENLVLNQNQKDFVNNSYLILALFRVGGNLAFNRFLKSDNGQQLLSKYFNQCDNFVEGSESFTKALARRALTEYGFLRPGACFVAGTLVAEKNEAKPIEKIKKNDWVYSWDFIKNAVTLQRVVRTFERTTTQLVHLFIGKDTIHTTPEHPFFVPNDDEQVFASTESNVFNKKENGSWILAKNLRKGMKVMLLSSLLATVGSSYTQDTVCTVYNFEVEGTHNYFVGRERVLVHNLCTVAEFLKLSRAEQLLEIDAWWQSGFPQFFERGRFIEDLVHDTHFKGLGYLDANDIAKNFETIDNFKPKPEHSGWKFFDNGIVEEIKCETAVSIKSTKDVDLKKWLEKLYDGKQKNLQNIEKLNNNKGLTGKGFTCKKKTVLYEKGELRFIVEESNLENVTNNWLPQLKKDYPNLDFKVMTLNSLVKP